MQERPAALDPGDGAIIEILEKARQQQRIKDIIEQILGQSPDDLDLSVRGLPRKEIVPMLTPEEEIYKRA